MHRVILALTLLLAGCGGSGPPTEAAFRSADVPIWSAAAFAPAQIAGRWQQVAAYQATPDGKCQAGALEFQPASGGLAVEGTLCLNGAARKVSGIAQPVGPGRLALQGEEDWWILWVDSGYRTLAIGTPSGSFGFVLDRGTAAPDRLAAAREVFDFNGYAAGAFRAF
jgi:apolipoprotein D and lipocalin family protein